MENNESDNDSKLPVTTDEPRSADRRSFMRAAVKTAVAGGVVAGIAASVTKAEAAPRVAAAGACGAAVEVPKAVVKARVLLNNQMQIGRQNIIDILGGIFDGSVCAACGLGGYPGPIDPGTVTQISVEMAYLPKDQLSAVIFSDAGGNGC
jgi:hypothetical protein